jgi:bifunctional non-homologous end joining protein LigD
MADTLEVKVGNRRFELGHPDKSLFPADGITKSDLLSYYREVAPAMLPHLADRPLMLQRFPDGIEAGGFYQKDAPDYFPDWIKRVRMRKEGGTLDHVVCNDEATLAYLASQACITLHPWLSRADRPDRPDQVVFDLDPSGADFDLVRQAAQTLCEMLDEMGLASFPKTTGSSGLHVVVPIERRQGFEAVRRFADQVASRLAASDPSHLTTEARKDRRAGRIFIDIGRNAYAQTAVAPYAVRALPGAPVAAPLERGELSDPSLTPRCYTVANMARRMAGRGDPWVAMADHSRQRLPHP